jgi:hypothetical protein
MTLSIFVKGKVDLKHIKIWLWVYLSKEKLTLDMWKYDFKYVCQRKNWLLICPNMISSMSVKKKVDFKHVQIWHWVFLLKEKFNFRYVQIWLWVCLWKEKLTSDMSKYDFDYVCERKSWL